MRKMLLFTLSALLFAACSKDDQNQDSECGVVISQTARSDGGIQENVKAVGCGDTWRSLQQSALLSDLLFKKGIPRSTATYLVSIKADTIYIRYEPGPVPTKTIDSFKNIGYTPKVTIISGLEHVKWP